MPVEDTKENLSICMEYCGTCPSLPFPPQPFLYCARGKASEGVTREGCKCPQCPVFKNNNLQGQDPYFCEHGKAP